jgi:hypothetical protein
LMRLYREGVPITRLAEGFGVSGTTVLQVPVKDGCP